MNIAQHELASYGKVQRNGKGNYAFSEVRLYLESEILRTSDVLYVCGTPSDAQALAAAGAHYLYVAPNAHAFDAQADISVIGGEPLPVVFNALLDVLYRFSGWEREMDRICFTGGDLQDLLDASAAFLVNHVVVVDPALKLLAYTKDTPCDDPVTMELIAHGYHTEENIRKFKLHKRFEPWSQASGFVINDSYEICNYVTVVKSFKTRSSFSMIVVMTCNMVQPDDYLLDLYSLFTQRVELFAKRDYPDDKPTGNAADTFLKDLFSGELRDRRVIEERCRHVGVPFKEHFCLFYIESGDDPALQPRLLSDVSRLVAPAKTVLFDGAVVVLCFNCTSERCALHCESGSCALGVRSISQRLDEMLGRYDLTCGRSSKFTKLTNAYNAYRQAREAHRLGQIRAKATRAGDVPQNWSRIYSFDSYCIDYLVECATDDDADLLGATYAHQIIEEIAQRDAEQNTDNYAFLRTYLSCERRSSVVAEALHMHRNNVTYRINRIEHLYGLDTEDPILRFDLLLAYKMREAARARK